MDKYEYKVRSEEISKLINEEKYAEAVKIADTIDWRRVKSTTMLLKVSALYRVNKRNEDSRDVLLLAYERYPTNRSVVYSLCDLSIELDDIVAALEYFKQYAKIAPDDSGVYVLRYRILETQDANLDERIEILEDLKVKDYQVEWVYELAYLYHRAGYITKCVETCDELILWIGDGPYVMKAMELKAMHVPLTEQQEAKYNFMLANAQSNYSASGFDQDDDQGIVDENYDPNYNLDYDPNYDENGNYIGDGYSDNYDGNESYNEPYNDSYNESYNEGYDSNYDENYNENYNEGYDSQYNENYNEGYDSNYDENGNYIGDGYPNNNYEDNYEDDNYQGGYNDGYQEQTYDENGELIEQQSFEQAEEQKPPVDMSQYNTINLQKVVAESMKELFPDDDVFAEEREKLNGDEVYKNTEAGDASDGSTIIYGRFGEDSEKPKETESDANTNIEANDEPKTASYTEADVDAGSVAKTQAIDQSDDNAPITGQMKIDDVLAEWERLKVDNAKRHQEEIRNQIFSQTGQMLADFDDSVNNDIMAKLEDDKAVAAIKDETADGIADGIEELEEIHEAEDAEEEMSELEKAVAHELGGTTQNIPYEIVKDIAEASMTIDTVVDDDSVMMEMESFGEGYYEENQLAEVETQTPDDEVSDIEVHDSDSFDSIEKEAADEKVGNGSHELDSDETQDIVEMAKEDAIKTQEIKLNTADLSNLSEKIMETTTKEATGAKREEIRSFTTDEQELFENFAVTKKIKKQIINAIDNMSLAAYTGNVIITGDAGLDTMRMAKNLIKEYQSQDPNFSGKIAKITGEKINNKDIRDIFDKLDNGGIIIEKANGMSEQKLYEMSTLLNQENLGIIVILEDTKKEISKLLEKQAMIVDYFNLRIDLMEMDNNALVAYAKNYALALEYAIDELGTLALYTRIANMQSGNHVVTKDEVRDIIDEAIYKSKKSKIKNFVDVLFSRRYDSEDMIVLKERDFI